MYHNMTKARQRWAATSQVLAHEGANARVSRMFYKAAAQTVLLYGSAMWVRTQAMDQSLAGFHHRVARKLSGKGPRLHGEQWIYPPVEEALKAAALYPMAEYLTCQRNRLLAHVINRPVFELCQWAERLPGTSTRSQVWWEQT
jgi:citrate synthase